MRQGSRTRWAAVLGTWVCLFVFWNPVAVTGHRANPAGAVPPSGATRASSVAWPTRRQSAEVSVGVRPERVRVGGRFTVTVRVEGPGWPDEVDLEPVDGVSIEEYEDRAVATPAAAAPRVTFQRAFHVVAERPGRVIPTTVVVFGKDTLRREAPAVQVHPAGLTWPTDPRTRTAQRGAEDREGRRPLPEGVPPSATGRDADRERAPQGLYPPGVRYPYAPSPGVDPSRWPDPFGYPTGGGGVTVPPYGITTSIPYGSGGSNPYASPYAPSGWGLAPDGAGWAPTAAGDPWWPELVPRLERYATFAEDPSGLARLEAGLTPPTVYVGQQVTFLATATFPPEALARLGGAPEFTPPESEDAWTVDLPYAPPTPAAAGGRAREAHTFMRAFFPLRAGVLQVGEASLAYSVGGGVPGRPLLDRLSTEPLSVEVLPVPAAEAPAAWSGAVGRYTLRAWVEPSSVPLGEAALLTVAVAGAGNVRMLQRPDPGAVWGAELRPTGERAVPEVRDGVVGGVKTFSWLVAPVEPGPLRIGPIVFAYFDPWTGAFAQTASEELILQVGGLTGR